MKGRKSKPKASWVRKGGWMEGVDSKRGKEAETRRQ